MEMLGPAARIGRGDGPGVAGAVAGPAAGPALETGLINDVELIRSAGLFVAIP